MPDPGAPCEEVLTIDLATVDPLVFVDDATGLTGCNGTGAGR